MTEAHRHLRGLAAAVLQPGFEGTAPPDWVRRWLGEGLGAVALFARNISDPAQVARLTSVLRAENPAVLVTIDEEAGDVTRLESRYGSSRPGNLALGAVDDVTLTEAVARDLGEELAAVGVTLNYAPDADVNSDPDNPVIGVRSFGACPRLVARHTAAWVRGLQSAGVAACAKHFPGHGNTSVDSHLAIPLISATGAELEACELVPFRAAIEAGVKAIMTGHLVVPAYDPDLPATVSRAILTGLLREELGYQGLIVTDGIEMKAVCRRYGLAGAAVRALTAGADAVCVGGDHADEATAESLRDAIVAAVISGELPEERLADAAERVRRLAEWTLGARREDAPSGDARPNRRIAGGGGNGRATIGGNGNGATPVGLTAARRAVRVIGSDDGAPPLPPLTVAPHVAEFVPPSNIAIGDETPWGMGEPLVGLLPGTTTVRLDDVAAADPAVLAARVLAPATDRPLVVVVRDAHRHAWMTAAMETLLAARPDAVVVEMGLPATAPGRTRVVTYGATRANAQAAAELLTGRC